MSLFVLTGWDLSKGFPIFLGTDGHYQRDFHRALVFGIDQQDQYLQKAKEDAKIGKIVDPYLIEVIAIVDQYLPLKKKEQLRLQGPTILKS